MQLPASGGLPVQLLASCFNYTSATYKYYWLLSIIQAVENHQTTIDKKVLFARMLANAWYTVNYFRVSFGKQDLIQESIRTLPGPVSNPSVFSRRGDTSKVMLAIPPILSTARSFPVLPK